MAADMRPDFDLDRFAKILDLAISTTDGEALSAVDKAAAMLKRCNMTFEDLFDALRAETARHQHRRLDRDTPERVAALTNHLNDMRRELTRLEHECSHWHAMAYMMANRMDDELFRLQKENARLRARSRPKSNDGC